MAIEVVFFPHLIHLSSDGQSPIIFDVKTNRIMEVDYVTATIIEEAVVQGNFSDRTYDSAKEMLIIRGVDYSNFDESIELISSLQKHGLFSEESIQTPGMGLSPNTYRSVLLNVSSVCQLKCEYCFASGGDYGNAEAPVFMTLEIGKRAIDYFISLFDKTQSDFNVVFFGGEPLTNWDAIEKLTLYTEEKVKEIGKSVRFNMTTNAIGITDHIAKFMSEHSFSFLVSIDGNEELHDELRPLASGEPGSYLKTVEGISVLKKYFPIINCRATVTSLETNVTKLEEALISAGGDYNFLNLIHDEPHSRLMPSWLDVKNFVQSIRKKIQQSSSVTIPTVLEMRDRVENTLIRPWNCGFGIGSSAVSTDGQIYACNMVTSDERFHIGSIDEGINFEKVYHLRKKANVDRIFGCRSCWLRYLCSGGCTVRNILEIENVYAPNPYACYMYKKLFEETIETILLDQKNG